MKLKIETISDPEQIKAIGKFRANVWQQENMRLLSPIFTENGWLDKIDFLPTTYHWAISHNNQFIASARLSFHDNIMNAPDSEMFLPFIPSYKGKFAVLSRLVVAKPFRNLGLGKLLDKTRLQICLEEKVETILAYAVGEHRARALEHFGFNVCSYVFKDKIMEIPHSYFVVMTASLDEIKLTESQPSLLSSLGMYRTPL